MKIFIVLAVLVVAVAALPRQGVRMPKPIRDQTKDLPSQQARDKRDLLLVDGGVDILPSYDYAPVVYSSPVEYAWPVYDTYSVPLALSYW